MTEVTSADVTTRTRSTTEPTGWVGWIIYAAVMMMILGGFHAMQGLIALFNDDYYLVGPEGLVVNVDITAWGWTHLILGTLVVLAGFGVLAGQMWARVVGIVLAVVSVFVSIGFLAAYPVWGALSIAIAVLVIYALTAHGSELKSV